MRNLNSGVARVSVITNVMFNLVYVAWSELPVINCAVSAAVWNSEVIGQHLTAYTTWRPFTPALRLCAYIASRRAQIRSVNAVPIATAFCSPLIRRRIVGMRNVPHARQFWFALHLDLWPFECICWSTDVSRSTLAVMWSDNIFC